MEHITINLTPFLPVTLEKDLQPGEEICPKCHGLGLIISNNRFSVEGDKQGYGNWFPHNNESIIQCPVCYNGVVKRCQYCGKIGQKGYSNPAYNCSCDGADKARRQRWAKEANATYEKATKITLDEATTKFEMLYSADDDEYISLGEFDDWIELKYFDYPEFEIGHIYGTTETNLTFDAYNLVSNACEELHEDAVDNIGSPAIKELQDQLNEWCKNNASGAGTYYPDYSVAVVIPEGYGKRDE